MTLLTFYQSGERPTKHQLLQKDMAVNLADKIIFFKDTSQNIVALDIGGVEEGIEGSANVTGNSEVPFEVASATEPTEAVTKDQLDTSLEAVVHTVDTISDLSSVDTTEYTNVNVLGYHSKNDGGGGIFNYDSSLSAVDDGGIVIDGWVRQFVGNINVRWFGAKGDGSTDDTTAFYNASDYANDNETVTGEAREVAIEIPIGDFPIAASPVLLASKWVILSGAKISGQTMYDSKYDNTDRLLGTIINYTNKATSETTTAMTIGEPSVFRDDADVGGQALFGVHSTTSGFAIRGTSVEDNDGIALTGYARVKAGTEYSAWGLYLEGVSRGTVAVDTTVGNAFGAEITVKKEDLLPYTYHPFAGTDPTYGKAEHIRLTTGSQYNAYETFAAIPEVGHANSYITFQPKSYIAATGGADINFPVGHDEAGTQAYSGAMFGLVFKERSVVSEEVIIMPYDYKVTNYVGTTSGTMVTHNSYRDGRDTYLVHYSDTLANGARLSFLKAKADEDDSATGDVLGVIYGQGLYSDSVKDLTKITFTQTSDFDASGYAGGKIELQASRTTSDQNRGLRITFDEVEPTVDGVTDLGTSSYKWNSIYSQNYYAGASGLAGVSGSFTTADSKTVTVTNGIITSIV